MAKVTTTTQGEPLELATPGKVFVYDADGNRSEVWPVDAQEIIAAGGSYEPPAKSKPEPEEAEPQEKELEDYTVAALKDLAEERGVDLSNVTKKADIIAAIRAVEHAEE